MNFLRWRNRPVLSFALLILGIFVVIAGFILGIHQGTVMAKLNEWKLIPHAEPVTELYLNNYLNLPKTITVRQTVPFSFTIHNLEGKVMAYPYNVYLQTTDGAQIPIANNNVTIANGDTKVVYASYTFTGSSSPVTIFVELPSVGETVHFILPSGT